MKQIILIYGPSGSGTSTLAAAISLQTGFAHLDTDGYLWMPTDPPFTTKRSPLERLICLRQDIARAENAVISGSLVGWGDAIRKDVTLAVRLYAPTDVRIRRIKQREFERFGARILPGGDMYEQHQAFLKWASDYDDGGPDMRSIAQHDLWQQGLCCDRLELDGTLPVETLTDAVLKKLGLPEQREKEQI